MGETFTRVCSCVRAVLYLWWTSPRPISTGQLHPSQVNVEAIGREMKLSFQAGFPLRCFQRLSLRRSQPAMLLAEQLAPEVRPSVLVLGTALLKSPTRAAIGTNCLTTF